MKIPLGLSSLLVLVSFLSALWINGQSLDINQKLTLFVYIATACGALISAIFVVYGYLVSLSVFKESQKPKMLIQVLNSQCKVNGNQNFEHQTVIRYANLSNNECRSLKLKAELLNDKESIIIDRLFSPETNLCPGDDRQRSFPTTTYFRKNNIPLAILENLQDYKLKVSYEYRLMNEITSSAYVYRWNGTEWQIA
ncbi:hypothetical protein [Vibrio lentus]|uniref:hypothetical protein n=1 Tax=Vibrio lentus TaxID=136468 RepID=UPI002479C0FF|nr:hypothetical protein [Vibrio lentus]WGS63653.1 hypothetical protein ISX51_18805 [Vibrio lentus]WGS63667.1 hypothetical protein ISX51_18880 [Vibrio lentus]